jgi:hypothetical protein
MNPNFSKYMSLRTYNVSEGARGRLWEPQEQNFVHLPGRDDKLLGFGARVGVDVMRAHKEEDLSGDVAVRLVLSRRHRSGDEEQNEPGNANFVKHLEIQDSNSRVQLRAHEKVVNRVSCQTVGPATDDRLRVHDDAIDEA